MIQAMNDARDSHDPIHIQPIDYVCPLSLFTLFKEEQGAILLGSALQHAVYGRYSYIAVDPFEWVTVKDEPHLNMKALLKNWLIQYPQPMLYGLPPFQGGIAGAFAYEFHRYIEDLPITTQDDVGFPDIAVGLYDVVIAFDHHKKKAWIISTGWPEKTDEARAVRARRRLAHYLERIQQCVALTTIDTKFTGQVRSNFTQDAYESAVTRVIDYILAGDIFEANISQRFEVALPEGFSPFDCYVQAWQENPAPFSAWMHFDDTSIISASPERFVKLSQGAIETRPIKGTCRRGKTHVTDEALANGLKNSEKDRAENIMIVDLLRNDLSKVCMDHSVQVTQLCEVETYAHVHHLVSVITGALRKECNAVDVLWALFPGGSITGAPKIRAMQIIAEIEKINRGIYCGSMGYIGFNGEMDLSIAIRTATIKNNRMYFQAGGAVVADSSARAEYDETLTKSAFFRNKVVSEVQHDFVD